MEKYKNFHIMTISSGNVPSSVAEFIITEREYLVSEEDSKSYDKIEYIITHINEFVQGKYSLVLYSHGTGNGKTLNAVRIANSYADGSEFYFVNVPELMQLKKDAISNTDAGFALRQVEGKIGHYPVVVWDDIATKGFTDFENNYLYNLLNNRSGTNIFTCNLSPEEAKKCMDMRVYDRAFNGSEIELTGKSFRKRDFFERGAEIENIDNYDTQWGDVLAEYRGRLSYLRESRKPYILMYKNTQDYPTLNKYGWITTDTASVGESFLDKTVCF